MLDLIQLRNIEVAEIVPIGGWAKRTFDLVVATIALAAMLPLFVCVALIVKSTSPGPALFRHQRVGHNGRGFYCYKFRTMVVDADIQLRRFLGENGLARAEWEICEVLKSDPRVTWVGKILRLSSIDGLPQLVNVLSGDMSLVGPRPIVEREISRYHERFADYRLARPGITGRWQLSCRKDTTFEERADLDRLYVQNWSFLGDIMIIMKTAPAVLSSRGCY
jgi:exopolysaccharide production protein ExoY